jgi:hypothetical protein
MVDYIHAEPQQQGIGAIMGYVLAGILQSEGVEIIASGTDTPAAVGLMTKMGATRTSPPDGYKPSSEAGTPAFFRANAASARAKAATAITDGRWIGERT